MKICERKKARRTVECRRLSVGYAAIAMRRLGFESWQQSGTWWQRCTAAWTRLLLRTPQRSRSSATWEENNDETEFRTAAPPGLGSGASDWDFGIWAAAGFFCWAASSRPLAPGGYTVWLSLAAGSLPRCYCRCIDVQKPSWRLRRRRYKAVPVPRIARRRLSEKG